MENKEKKDIQEEAKKILSRIQFADPKRDFDLVMEQLLNYADLLTKSFSERIKTTLHGKKLEDNATKFFEVPGIQEIINKLEKRRELYEKVCTNVRGIYAKQNKGEKEKNLQIGDYNIEITDEVITPPDEGEMNINYGGENPFEEKEIQPRLERVLFLLKNYEIKDEDVGIRIGKVGPNMMRKLSYVSLFVKSLNKTIYVCNEEGNITFIINTNDEEERDVLDQMSKEEKKDYLSQTEGTGIYFRYDENWYGIMETYLFKEEIERREKHTLEYFDKLSVEEKKNILRDIILSQGVLKIENKKLIWLKSISPQKKYNGYTSPLNILLGKVFGVSGALEYKSFGSIVPKIRELFKGEYETEEDPENIFKTGIQKEFDEADVERQKAMIKELVQEQGVLKIEGNKLIWLKIVNPNNKYNGYTSKLNTLLGKVFEVNGAREYTSFESIVLKIRELFKGEYETEEDPANIFKTGIQKEFDESDVERKKEMLKELIQEEGVLKIEGKKLIWLKSINPNKKYNGYTSPLNTLLGNAFGGSGAKEYLSFGSIVLKIRELFKGEYETEEDPANIFKTGIQKEFDESDVERKKEMLKELIQEEGVLKIEGKKLIWLKSINPNKKYNGYTSPLNTLLGRLFGVKGQKEYLSFGSIVPKIRELFQGEYDTEEDPNGILKQL